MRLRARPRASGLPAAFLAPAVLGIAALALAALLAAVALAAETRTTSLASVGGNGPFEAELGGITADGSRVFLETEEALLPVDSDESTDVYERSGGATTLISTGPGGSGAEESAAFRAATADGSRVFFTTREALLPADTDAANDVYERAGDSLVLISVGPDGGDGPFGVVFRFASEDGNRVLFETEEPLVAADEDAARDLYERSGGATTLISTGPEDGNGPAEALFATASQDGARAFFRTREALVEADEDESIDLYERAGAETALVSTGPAGGNGAHSASGGVASADGSRVFFSTTESLVAEDDDGAQDAYERFEGVTSLVTTGASGNAGQVANLFRISSDGTRAFFLTYGALDPADTDGSEDIYERSGGQTSLLSIGPAGGDGAFNAEARGISADGSHAYFATREPLVAADSDEAIDIYERSGDVTTLISVGPAGGNAALDASFGRSTADGSRVYFATDEALVASDGDSARDLYERAAGITTLISTGPEDAEAGGIGFLLDISADGNHVAFGSYESLLAADADEELDVYVSSLDPSPGPGDQPVPPTEPTAPALPSSVPRCAGKPATIVGTGKRDVLKGTGRRDVIVAGGGNDKILARGGNDIVCAGTGKDVVIAGAGGDRVFGQGGDDRLFGQGGRDFLFGNGGRDLLNGGAHDKDRCRGGAGEDRLRKCER